MQQPQSSYTDSVVGEVSLNYSSRARRVSIAVLPTGVVRLNLPRGANLASSKSFVESRRVWIMGAKQRMAKLAAEQPAPIQVTPELRAKLLVAAKSHLPQRIEMIAKALGLSYSGLGLRALRSKWGSCRIDNRITLSTYLMLLPQHLIDFVIIHELCHTVHHNHSAAFHALVNRYTKGNERELHKELKLYRCIQ